MEKIIVDEPKMLNRIFNIINKVEEDDDFELNRQLIASAVIKKVIIEVYEDYVEHLVLNYRTLARLHLNFVSHHTPGKAIDVDRNISDQLAKTDTTTRERYVGEAWEHILVLCRDHLETIDEK